MEIKEQLEFFLNFINEEKELENNEKQVNGKELEEIFAYNCKIYKDNFPLKLMDEFKESTMIYKIINWDFNKNGTKNNYWFDVTDIVTRKIEHVEDIDLKANYPYGKELQLFSDKTDEFFTSLDLLVNNGEFDKYVFIAENMKITYENDKVTISLCESENTIINEDKFKRIKDDVLSRIGFNIESLEPVLKTAIIEYRNSEAQLIKKINC